MSSHPVYQALLSHPQYQTLVQRRSRLAFTLSAIVLGLYSLFVAAVSWHPQLLLHVPLGGGLTTGIWSALILIIGSWLLTGLYVFRANNLFDKLTQTLLSEVKA
ncbi:Inner membrane protein YjcH [compost metagenome]